MQSEDILASADFKKCVDFHGHLCPGLSLGYKASRAGMEWLRSTRAVDEEVVAIVETDACCADAVQVITGCTFGKGNFFYKDYGKIAFTFINRKTGKGVRLSLKPETLSSDPRHQELMGKLKDTTASQSERAEFERLHKKRSLDILEKPVEEIFALQEVNIDPPQKAKIEPSKSCELCGEPTMGSKLSEVNGRMICRGCSASR